MSKPAKTVEAVRREKIRLDADTQPREEINQEKVTEYREAMERGDDFPHPALFFDGEWYWTADGFHRILAQDGKEMLTAEVRPGGRKEARLYACSANQTHGLPRNNADKRRAVTMALEEMPKSSDREIAKHCGVSNNFVGEIRHLSSDDRCPERTVTRGSQTYTLNTDNIGKSTPAVEPTPVREPGDESEAKIPEWFCDRCRKVGEVVGCPMCKERKLAMQPEKPKRDPAKEQPIHDPHGAEVPKRCRDAFCDPWPEETISFLEGLSEKLLMERIGDAMRKRAKHYPFMAPKDVTDGLAFVVQYLDQIVEHLTQKRPAGVCPSCSGKGCATCRSSGLLPADLFEAKEGEK